MNEIYSNGLKLYPFSGHSSFRVTHCLGDNSYEGARSYVNGDEVWV